MLIASKKNVVKYFIEHLTYYVNLFFLSCVFIYDTIIKNKMLKTASNRTKYKVQINSMNNVLNRIKTSSRNVARDRIILSHRVQAVLKRVVEMLTEFSHPSVQQYITASILGNATSNESIDQKNKDGKTMEQIKREKRAALIESMSVNNIVNGFSVVERECLEIINLYWKKEQDPKNTDGRKESFFVTQNLNKSDNQNTRAIFTSPKRYRTPYGPNHPHGTLDKQLGRSKYKIRSTLPKVRGKMDSASTTNVLLQEEKKQDIIINERFFTRDELMASTIRSFGGNDDRNVNESKQHGRYTQNDGKNNSRNTVVNKK